MKFNRKLFFLITIISLFSLCVTDIEHASLNVDRYKGYSLIEVTPSTNEQLLEITKFETDSGYDFWSHIRQIRKPIRILMEPNANDLKFVLDELNLKYKVLTSDVANISCCENEDASKKTRNAVAENDKIPNSGSIRGGEIEEIKRKTYSDSEISFEKYNTLFEIEEYLNNLDTPDLTVTTYGMTSGGNEILGVKVSRRGAKIKPAVLIVGGIDARDWLGIAAVLYIITAFAGRNDPEIKILIDELDWFFIPVVNPDGYKYSHYVDRFWKKSRSVLNEECLEQLTSLSLCGVDLNRNFETLGWKSDVMRFNHMTDKYAGIKPFSEEESSAIRRCVLENDNIVLYVSFHSSENFISYPPNTHDVNTGDLKKLALEAKKIMENYDNSIFTVDQANELFGSSMGMDIDWVQNYAEVPLSFSLSLYGNKSTCEYDVPPADILVGCRKAFGGVRVFAQHLFANGVEYLKQKKRARKSFYKRRRPNSQSTKLNSFNILISTVLFVLTVWLINLNSLF